MTADRLASREVAEVDACCDLSHRACSPLGDDVVGGDDYILVIFQATACGFQKQIDHVADKGVKYLLRIVSKDL